MDGYKTFDEKNQFFKEMKIIRTKEELDSFVEELERLHMNKSLHCVYRGLNNASFKLLNSFQRLWKERQLTELGLDPGESVYKMIKTCRQKQNVLFKYMKSMGVMINDWLILSFLQHYGAHTPILDFSKNYKTALFFACKDVEYKGMGGIEDYISIYYYKIVDAAQHFQTLDNLATRKAQALTPTHKQEEFWGNRMSFKNVTDEFKIVVLPTYSVPSVVMNKDKEPITRIVLSNINSINQEGEFVMNMVIDSPLEEQMQYDHKPLIYCANIHKGLVDYIISKYLGGSIDIAQKLYFRNEYDIAREAEMSFLSLG